MTGYRRHPRLLLFILFLIVASIFLFLFFRTAKKSYEFVFVLTTMPEKISPFDSVFDSSSAIIEQMYRTVFSYDSGELSSDVLSSWEASDDFRSFALCPKSSTKFTNGRTLTAPILHENLSMMLSLNGFSLSDYSMDSTDSCVNVKFSNPYYRFFDQLSRPAFFIIDPTSKEKDFPVGISNYCLSSKSANEIILAYCGDLPPPVFDRIRFVTLDMVDKANIEMPLHEINRVPTRARDAIKREEYVEYSPFSPTLQYVLINSTNASLRKQFVRCFPKKEFTDRVIRDFPSVGIFHVPNSFIPFGLPGFLEEKEASVSSEMESSNFTYDKPFILAGAFGGLEGSISVVKDRMSQCGIKIETLDTNFKTSLRTITYDGLFIGYSSRDSADFLSILLDADPEKRLVNGLPINLYREFSETFSHHNNPTEYANAIRAISKEIIENGFAVPLFGVKVRYFYPPNIGGLETALSSRRGYYRVEDLFIK